MLRRGESGGERSFAFAGELGGSGGCRLVLEQLGNAEVEQLHLSIAGDKHVRRLEVPLRASGTLKAAADCPGAVLGEEDPISLALNY